MNLNEEGYEQLGHLAEVIRRKLVGGIITHRQAEEYKIKIQINFLKIEKNEFDIKEKKLLQQFIDMIENKK